MNKNHILLKKIGNGLMHMLLPCVLGIAACTWDEIPPPQVELPDTTISFSVNIIPIFEANCNTTNCHEGTWSPDLRPNVAYDELINGGYINTNSPQNSELYTKIASGGSMEQYATNQDRALILQWITEGAEDN